MRDRQLDTIRNWSSSEVSNYNTFKKRSGNQVTPSKLVKKSNIIHLIPLINIKMRPKDSLSSDIIYVWGGLIISGKFILDIDNPWSIVGYNVFAMKIYRKIIKIILLSKRCIYINCMSQACRDSVKLLFGNEVYKKTRLFYPRPNINYNMISRNYKNSHCKFLFVGTQFNIKGGKQLLEVCNEFSSLNSNASFTFITHFPEDLKYLDKNFQNIKIQPAMYNRSEIHKIMCNSDVLIHPSFCESFGMVILEAMISGLAVITTNMYATPELVDDGYNGFIIDPPISAWNEIVPSPNFLTKDLLKNLQNVSYSTFKNSLFEKIQFLTDNLDLMYEMKSNSRLKSKKLIRFND